MANIQLYLAQLEERLAPSLDVDALHERLTEAENHLRDRAQEFEEIGLPPLEAEARAVAAFGEPEEYATDVILPPAPSPIVVRAERPRDLSFQLAASILALGVLGAIGADQMALAIAIVVAAIVLGVGALFGRLTPIRRLAASGLALSIASFAVLMIAYVPGYTPFVAINRSRIETTSPTWMPNIDRFHRFERLERLYREYGQVRSDLAGSTIVPTGSDQGRFYGPTPDGTIESYSLEADALRAWQINGRDAHDALLNSAREEGLFFDVNATPRDRVKPFALNAFALGAMFVALVAGLQAFGSALRGGLLRLTRSAKKAESPRPPLGSWDRP